MRGHLWILVKHLIEGLPVENRHNTQAQFSITVLNRGLKQVIQDHSLGHLGMFSPYFESVTYFILHLFQDQNLYYVSFMVDVVHMMVTNWSSSVGLGIQNCDI